MHIENIYFDNNDTILHECIKLNNRQLTSELIRQGFNINVNGELGTPLVTAIHYNILWAVEMLLNNGADLTKRHIDWPFLTLYQYCIQFAKIDIKLIIDKHITSLIRKRNCKTIEKLINDGWNICSKLRHSHNAIHMK
jgi:ankyrin repeat protein